MTDPNNIVRRTSLDRLFRPRSIAVVGASTNQSRSNYAVPKLLESGAEIFLVNPKRPELYGQRTHPNLGAIGKPIDAVFAMVNAQQVMQIVHDAVGLDVGGIVVNAAGFAEAGGDGVELQRELLETAGATAILGPNCNGFIDVNAGIRLSGAPPLPIRGGSIGFVSHSGALIGSMGVIGFERGVGFSHMISTGNEASIDMTDCINFLIDDPTTKAICLAVESIRRPSAFFAAVERATRAGKPIVALKLGRSDRGRMIAASHTASIAGNAEVYDWAFTQHGIEIAYDLTELVDRVTCFDQLARQAWSPVNGLAMISASGGGAQLAADICAATGVDLPSLPDVKTTLQSLLPGVDCVNPLDMTGLAISKPELAHAILQAYADSPGVDTLYLQWFLDDQAREMGAAFLDEFVAIAQAAGKTAVIGSLEDGRAGHWASALPARGVGVTRGLVGTMRALQAMGRFVRHAERHKAVSPPVSKPCEPPGAADLITVEGGTMLRFDATMRLLQAYGIDIAPYLIVQADQDARNIVIPFDGPYVVKLADVPHRTELGAVRVGVDSGGIAQAVAQMRSIADKHGLPAEVAIQPKLSNDGEVFLGVQTQGDLGSVVACGVGGVFVELLRAVVGAVVPFSRDDAYRQLQGLERTRVFDGWRGAAPWDRNSLAEAMVKAGDLATHAGAWLLSMDINPLIASNGRFVAVDGLCFIRETGDESACAPIERHGERR